MFHPKSNDHGTQANRIAWHISYSWQYWGWCLTSYCWESVSCFGSESSTAVDCWVQSVSFISRTIVHCLHRYLLPIRELFRSIKTSTFLRREDLSQIDPDTLRNQFDDWFVGRFREAQVRFFPRQCDVKSIQNGSFVWWLVGQRWDLLLRCIIHWNW